MNYAALPPEINSIRIYSGPGSAPLRAAASAWGGLATELRTTVAAYESVLAELTGRGWAGPASAAMSAAATSYIGWLAATAAATEQTAAQAAAAAAAYEAAFAMTVPPSVVAANRAQLLALVAANVFGQNTAAIAAVETHYGQMWAQDAAAMYGYAAASAPAADLAPFTPAPRTTNPAGQASQLASAASALPQAAAAPAQGLEDLIALPGLSDLAGISAVSTAGLALSAGAWSSADASTREILLEQEQVQEVEYDILHAIDLFSPLTPSRPAGAMSAAAGLSRAMSAGLGEAVSVGKLAVPLSWAAAAPEIRSLSYTLPLAGPTAAAPLPLSAAGTAFSQMGLAGMGGSALAGSVGRTQGQAAPVQRTAAPAAPAAPAVAGGPGEQVEPGPPLTGIAAEIREFAALRDRGLISNDEYTEQKLRLLGR